VETLNRTSTRKITVNRRLGPSAFIIQHPESTAQHRTGSLEKVAGPTASSCELPVVPTRRRAIRTVGCGWCWDGTAGIGPPGRRYFRRRASRRFPVLCGCAALCLVGPTHHPPALRGRPTARCLLHYGQSPSQAGHAPLRVVRRAHGSRRQIGAAGSQRPGTQEVRYASVHCGAGARRGAMLRWRRRGE
jgi:hypothetical protein